MKSSVEYVAASHGATCVMFFLTVPQITVMTIIVILLIIIIIMKMIYWVDFQRGIV